MDIGLTLFYGVSAVAVAGFMDQKGFSLVQDMVVRKMREGILREPLTVEPGDNLEPSHLD